MSRTDRNVVQYRRELEMDMSTPRLPKRLKIHSSDRCAHCGHLSVDAGEPFRIYSGERAKWLEEAAAWYFEIRGGDDWFDWVGAGERLTKGEQ
jgi:hypothetical protein